MTDDSSRFMRRTKIIVLTIVGAGIGLTIYNAVKTPETPTTETRNVYKSREDCLAATNDPSKCEPSQGRGGYGHGSYFGPILFPGGSTADRSAPPTPGARPAPTPIGQYQSQRGGFGGSSSGYHYGG